MSPAVMKGLSGSRIRKASNMGFLLVFSGGGKWLVNAVSSLSPEWIGSVGLPFSSPSSRYSALPLHSCHYWCMYVLQNYFFLRSAYFFSLLSAVVPGYILPISELRHWILVCSLRQVVYIR